MLLNREILIGIIFLCVGVLGIFLAESINDRKKFKIWKKEIEKLGINQRISSTNDVQLIISIYNSCPDKKLGIEYINNLNPVLADELREYI